MSTHEASGGARARSMQGFVLRTGTRGQRGGLPGKAWKSALPQTRPEPASGTLPQGEVPSQA